MCSKPCHQKWVSPVPGRDRGTVTARYRDTVGRVTAFVARREASPGEGADIVAATCLVTLEKSDEEGEPP